MFSETEAIKITVAAPFRNDVVLNRGPPGVKSSAKTLLLPTLQR